MKRQLEIIPTPGVISHVIRTRCDVEARRELAERLGLISVPPTDPGAPEWVDVFVETAIRAGALPDLADQLLATFPDSELFISSDENADTAPSNETYAEVPPPTNGHRVDSASAPLMHLRDGVEQLEMRRLDARELETEVTAPHLPFRFVHGYTLPTHWARRDAELDQLADLVKAGDHRVLSLVAIGGTGKSALTRKLLDELPARGVPLDGALWFSFYVEPEFDRFLTEACRYLVPDFDAAAHPSPYEKSLILREALDAGHYLLVLDGIEVLLVSDTSRPDYGAFQDQALREFLVGLCEGSRSQTLISSRFSLAELNERPGYFPLRLGDLAPDAAVELLQSYGISGTDSDYRRIELNFGNHALTLQILADYLVRFHGGEIAGVEEIRGSTPTSPQGIKLQAALDAYWQHLETNERFFLTRMSAFRGGVDERSFVVLNRSGDAFSQEFRKMVSQIIKSPLVSVERREGRPRLTAHPLVKTFFYERMGDAERSQTHRALKDYAQGLPMPDRPRTLADYEPLLEACHHCLQVGLYNEAYQIYRRNNLDNALRWWGHYAQAVALLEPLREAALGDTPTWQNERWQRSWVENETALVAMLRGDTGQALERFRNSAAMDADAGDRSGESASWQNIAGILTQQGDFCGALDALNRSHVIEAGIARFEKEDLLAGLEGICHGELGHTRRAFELLARAAGISMQRGNRRALCYWTWRIGDLHLRLKHIEQAKVHYQEALRVAQEEQYRDYEGHSLRGLADAALAVHNPADAAVEATAALRVARLLGNPYLEHEVILTTAHIDLMVGSRHDAMMHANQAFSRAQTCGYRVQCAQSQILIARCARAAQDEGAYREAILLADRLVQESQHFWTRVQLNELTAPV